MSIGQAFGILVASPLLGAFIFNGLIMLISPARWFRLPSYLAFRGTLRERDYVGKAIGRIQIRIVGLIFAGFPLYILIERVGVHPRFLRAMESEGAALILRFRWWLSLIVCLSVIACGFVMLLRPKWWITKYVSVGAHDIPQALLERIVRVMGLPVIAAGGYFLYLCTAMR